MTRTTPPMSRDTAPGLVIANLGHRIEVEDSRGDLHHCVPRRALGPVVCGDGVVWRQEAHGGCIITEVSDRRTLLGRPDRRGKLKPFCANIDQLVVVSALRPDREATRFIDNTPMIDSYLAAAALLGLEATLALNKIDLATPEVQSAIESVTARYRRVGYRVVLTSAKDGIGIEELQRALQQKTSVVVGESGVGKSSLIDVLLPEQELNVGRLSENSGLGRHTTSVTTLFHLPHGGDIIDSPGVREFRLWRVAPDQLARGFIEFDAYLGRCRYRDCRHDGDAGCAVAAAVDEGTIDAQRLANYRRLLEGCT